MNETPIPIDIDAEESVLGSVLIDHDCLLDLRAMLAPEDFYRDKHRWIFEAMCALVDGGQSLNRVTVAHQLNSRLEDVGGRAFLDHLIVTVPTSVHALDYAEIVKRTAFQRRLISAAAQIAKVGYEGGEPVDLLGKAQEKLLALTAWASSEGFRTFSEVAAERMPELVEWVENPSRPRGIPTGFTDLDWLLSGLRKETYYVLAGRPGMGKSAWALQLAVNVAKQGKHVAIFSLEMSRGDILERAAFAQARLDRVVIQQGRVAGDWKALFWEAMETVERLPISVDSTESITTSTARARLSQLLLQKPSLGLVIFDYGELAGDANPQGEEQRISLITRRLQGMAHALAVPVLGIFQLNRQVEARVNKQPQLADLRWSGMLEQSADVVLMLYRKSYYARRDTSLRLAEGEENLLDVLIEKQRNGPTGNIKLFYEVATGRIGNWGDRRET